MLAGSEEATHAGRFGLGDVLAALSGNVRLSWDAEAALEGSYFFSLVDAQSSSPSGGGSHP